MVPQQTYTVSRVNTCQPSSQASVAGSQISSINSPIPGASDQLVFTPPLNSPELAAALEYQFPNIPTHKERQREASLKFFLHEKDLLKKQLERQQVMNDIQELERQKLVLEQQFREIDQALGSTPAPLPSNLGFSDCTGVGDIVEAPMAPQLGQSFTDLLPAGLDINPSTVAEQPIFDSGFTSSWMNDPSPVSFDPAGFTFTDPLPDFNVSTIDFAALNTISPHTSLMGTPKSTPILEADYGAIDSFSDTACATPAMGQTAPNSLTFEEFFGTANPHGLKLQNPMFYDITSNSIDSAFLTSPQLMVQPSPVQALAIESSSQSACSPGISNSNTVPLPADSTDHATSAAVVPEMDAFTNVWSLSPHSQPKRRHRRSMTDAEKKEYRIKRQNGACADCRKRRRKCVHPVSAALSPPSAATSSSAVAAWRAPVAVAEAMPQPRNTILQTEGISPRARLQIPPQSAVPMFTPSAEPFTTGFEAIASTVALQQQPSIDEGHLSLASLGLMVDYDFETLMSGRDLHIQCTTPFAAQDPQSWSDPSLFATDSGNQGHSVDYSSLFLPGVDPPRVSSAFAPEISQHSPQTQTHISSPIGRPRPHHLIRPESPRESETNPHFQAEVAPIGNLGSAFTHQQSPQPQQSPSASQSQRHSHIQQSQQSSSASQSQRHLHIQQSPDGSQSGQPTHDLRVRESIDTVSFSHSTSELSSRDGGDGLPTNRATTPRHQAPSNCPPSTDCHGPNSSLPQHLTPSSFAARSVVERSTPILEPSSPDGFSSTDSDVKLILFSLINLWSCTMARLDIEPPVSRRPAVVDSIVVNRSRSSTGVCSPFTTRSRLPGASLPVLVLA